MIEDDNPLHKALATAALLWALLDDIDTMDDACKNNDKTFRDAVRTIQRKRFKVLSGKSFELIANHAGFNLNGLFHSSTIDELKDRQ